VVSLPPEDHSQKIQIFLPYLHYVWYTLFILKDDWCFFGQRTCTIIFHVIKSLNVLINEIYISFRCGLYMSFNVYLYVIYALLCIHVLYNVWTTPNGTHKPNLFLIASAFYPLFMKVGPLKCVCRQSLEPGKFYCQGKILIEIAKTNFGAFKLIILSTSKQFAKNTPFGHVNCYGLDKVLNFEHKFSLILLNIKV